MSVEHVREATDVSEKEMEPEAQGWPPRALSAFLARLAPLSTCPCTDPAYVPLFSSHPGSNPLFPWPLLSQV